MKNFIYKYFAPVLLFAFVFVSCDKYLDVQPKGVRLLTTVNDYDLWLSSGDLATSIPREIILLADNMDNVWFTNPPVYDSERIYAWQQQFSENIKVEPVIWKNFYKSIYYYNTVLEGIDDATEGTEEQKKNLKAEALLGRAFNYLYLVNLYGKIYDDATANQNLAVPFVTSNDLTDPTPERSTVQEIYDHIISDLEAAIPELPMDNSGNRFRGSVAAGYSILARTYLYMGDYDKAAQNAQLALDNGPDAILDYTTMSSDYDIPALIKSQDAIYARLTEFNFSNTPTLAFLQSFDITDLRLKFYYTQNYGPLYNYQFETRGEIRYNPSGVSYGKADPNWGTSVAEMRLILAEAAARDNDLGTACDELDLLRKKRFPAADYIKFESTNQEEVLQKVLAERTFEFVFVGLRWFDMRRLDAEGRMPEVRRYDRENNSVTTLSPGSTKYTLQIPTQVLYFNPDWPQNPWD